MAASRSSVSNSQAGIGHLTLTILLVFMSQFYNLLSGIGCVVDLH